MDSLYGLPGKVLIIMQRCQTVNVPLPAYIDTSPCQIDITDPYLIFRSAANKIIHQISFLTEKYKNQGEQELNKMFSDVSKMSQPRALFYLLTNHDNTSSATISEESASILIEREMKIGEIYVEVAKDILDNNDIAECQVIRILEYYLKDRNCYCDINSDILLNKLKQNLKKYNRDINELKICEFNVALRTMTEQEQLYYYDLFTSNRGNEIDVWFKIRAHEYDIQQEKCLEKQPDEQLICRELVRRVEEQCNCIYNDAVIEKTLEYVCNEYVPTNFDGFIPYKVCMGIQERDGEPVFDVIGKQKDKVRIISFKIFSSNLLSIRQQCIVEVGNKVKVRVCTRNGLKRMY